MGTDIDTIKGELEELGYSTFIRDDVPVAPVVFFEYHIPVGKYSGQKVLLGISFAEQGYPEYPPHWIHISPPYNDERGGTPYEYSSKDERGEMRKFIAHSRPPKCSWDSLLNKDMKTYLNVHVTEFCKLLK